MLFLHRGQWLLQVQFPSKLIDACQGQEGWISRGRHAFQLDGCFFQLDYFLGFLVALYLHSHHLKDCSTHLPVSLWSGRKEDNECNRSLRNACNQSIQWYFLVSNGLKEMFWRAKSLDLMWWPLSRTRWYTSSFSEVSANRDTPVADIFCWFSLAIGYILGLIPTNSWKTFPAISSLSVFILFVSQWRSLATGKLGQSKSFCNMGLFAIFS